METQSVHSLSEKFGLRLTGEWDPLSLAVLSGAVDDFCETFRLVPPFWSLWLRRLEMRLEHLIYGGLTTQHLIRLNPAGLTRWTVVHEIGHAWDKASWGTLSLRMKWSTQSSGPVGLLHLLWPEKPAFWYRVGSPPAPCGVDGNFNRFEDFAEAVAAYVYPQEAEQKARQRGMPYGRYGYIHFRQTPRGHFIAAAADALVKRELALHM